MQTKAKRVEWAGVRKELRLSRLLDEGLGVFVPGAKYRPILVFCLNRHPGPLLSSLQPHLLHLGTLFQVFDLYSRPARVQLHCTVLFLLTT